MKACILDVGHGFCAFFVDDNRKLLMIDAGSGSEPSQIPSQILVGAGITDIELLIISNYDEDHLSDLPNLRNRRPGGPKILRFHRNRSLSVAQLRKLKAESGPISPAMTELLTMIEGSKSTSPADLPNIHYKIFCNSYPDFTDTNNLSLLTFVEAGGKVFCFPGDLEEQGWLKLLENLEVRGWLQRTRILIASHHGRESGYCAEVFNFCNPDIIIVSDKAVVHETQKQMYGSHAKGIRVGTELRFVLTTRKDGTIYMQKEEGLPFIINAQNWAQQVIL